MKKFLALTLGAICTIFCGTACASNHVKDTRETKKEETMNTNAKKLVAYFSHTGENYNVGYIEKGNTHIIAR